VGKAQAQVQLADDVSWRTKFLEALLSSEGDAEKAASEAGVTEVVARIAKDREPDFARDWEEIAEVIRQKRADEIERALYDRATGGAQRGRGFDVQAGLILLRGYRPERFAEDLRKKGPSEIQGVTDLFRAIGEYEKAHGALPPPDRPRLPAAPDSPTVAELVLGAAQEPEN
jgi:hypothetical protein